MLTVYGHPMSTCTRKVLCTLAEKDVPYELALVDFAKNEHKQEPHLSRQPFGRIPAIDDDGFELFESRAICRYLDESHDTGTKLIPAEPKTRAVMEKWISIETSEFSGHAMKIVMQLFFHPMRGLPVDQAVVAEARETLKKTIAVLEKGLEGKEFLAGDAFTLADLCYLPYIDYLVAAGQGDLFAGPNVSAWWTRCSTRPSWLKVTGKA